MPAEPAAQSMTSSLSFGFDNLLGGSMNIKFPDDPPVVFMT